MFCPACHCEFRPGFTRCGSCDVALVEHLDQNRKQNPASPAVTGGALADYCGFLSLDDARGARDRLGLQGIGSEITIRQPPGGSAEEFWLRVSVADFRRCRQLLGDGAEEDDAGFACSDCRRAVPRDAACCPHCGASFDS